MLKRRSKTDHEETPVFKTSKPTLLSVTDGKVKIRFRLLSSFEKVSSPGQIQTKLGTRVYLLLSQAAILPGSDAGSNVVKPASSFVIQNRQTLCSMWCPMYRARYENVVNGLFSGASLTIR